MTAASETPFGVFAISVAFPARTHFQVQASGAGTLRREKAWRWTEIDRWGVASGKMAAQVVINRWAT